MERIYAFTDEYGQFGWDLTKQDVSTCFIINSVIVSEHELGEFTEKAEIIRKKHFQNGEMKSSKVAGNFKRREQILQELSELPFRIFPVVINKKEYLENVRLEGLKYKPTFYKFMNNIVHKELRRSFEKLTIVADEIGENDYMASFCKYVDKNQDVANLLGEAKFRFQKSNTDVRIQVADFFAGTLGRIFDSNKIDDHSGEYLDIIKPSLIRIEKYPKVYDDFQIDDSILSSKYDSNIAKMCYSAAVTYLNNNEKKTEEDEFQSARLIVLQYLLFIFINHDEQRYINTNELILQLRHTKQKDISYQMFRSRIIGKLRDAGVIIASSNKGYKIPVSIQEIMDYVMHDARVVMPMLSRLKKCRDLVKMNTLNGVDVLNGTGFENLIWYFDNYPDKEN